MCDTETGAGDGRWMKLAEECIIWQAVLVVVLNLVVLLPES